MYLIKESSSHTFSSGWALPRGHLSHAGTKCFENPPWLIFNIRCRCCNVPWTPLNTGQGSLEFCQISWISWVHSTLNYVHKQPKKLMTSLCCLNFSNIWLVLSPIHCLKFMISITSKTLQKQILCKKKLDIQATHRVCAPLGRLRTRQEYYHYIFIKTEWISGTGCKTDLWFWECLLLSSKKIN